MATLPALPANLPGIATAKLPKTYESAKSALAECTRLDECDAWANKAEAMASYAKQADDDALMQMAQRIKARAIRRCGELLQKIQAATNQHDAKSRARVDLPPSRTQAAREAGMSRDRTKQALRIANIPAPAFEAAVEAPRAPSVKALADQGKASRPFNPPLVDLGGRDPKEYQIATQAQGQLREFATYTETTLVDVVLRGSKPHELARMRRHADQIAEWLRQLLRALDKETR